MITQLIRNREVVIASAGNRVKTSGSSVDVELETLKYVSSGYGRYLPDFVLYSTHEPCAMCAVYVSGRKSAPWCLAFPRKTSPPMARSTVPSNSNGVPVSFRANSSSKRADSTFPVFDGFFKTGVLNFINIEPHQTLSVTKIVKCELVSKYAVIRPWKELRKAGLVKIGKQGRKVFS